MITKEQYCAAKRSSKYTRIRCMLKIWSRSKKIFRLVALWNQNRDGPTELFGDMAAWVAMRRSKLIQATIEPAVFLPSMRKNFKQFERL